jgi:protein-S-isoprenylcysteine O-methyltransferase Ste14
MNLPIAVAGARSARLESLRTFCQTIASMDENRRDFFFRNRRWLLLLLFIPVFWSASFQDPTTERLARMFHDYATSLSLDGWRHAFYGLAAVLIALGALWRTWGAAYLGTNVVQDRQMHTECLVGDGPYRYTRNPLYLGNMFLVLGLGLLLGPLAYAILAVGMWILVRLFIRDEEAGLEASGGESYRAYCSAVPRMFPSWRARIPSAGAKPRWLQGFCGESFLWMLAVVTAGSGISLNSAWLQHRLLWGIVIALPLFIWARRSSKKQSSAAGPA